MKKTPKYTTFFARYTRKTTFSREAQEAPIFRQEAQEAREAPKTAYDSNRHSISFQMVKTRVSNSTGD